MATQEDQELTFSPGHTVYSYIWKNFLLKKKKKVLLSDDCLCGWANHIKVGKRKPLSSTSTPGTHTQTYPPQGPDQKLIMSRLKVKETHLLILKCQPQGQASNLIYTSGSLLEPSLRVKASRCPPCALSLVCFIEPVSFRRKILHASGASIFVAATQETLLDFLTLKVRGATVPGPMGL